jgi:hypothetical protein
MATDVRCRARASLHTIAAAKAFMLVFMLISSDHWLYGGDYE